MLHISQLVQNYERLKKDHDSSLKEFDCQLECLMSENRKLVKMVYLMKREIDQSRITLERLNSTIELKVESEANLSAKISTVRQERDDYYNRYRQVEREINKTRNEIDSLSNWRKVYED